MAAVYKLKNTSGADGEWAGQEIADGETYVIDQSEIDAFRVADDIFAAVANGDLQIENDTKSFIDPIAGWNYLSGDWIPRSGIDGSKLAVHPSYKPDIPGGNTYAVWSGAGDDVDTVPSVLGGGDLLHFEQQVGQPTTTKVVKFDHVAFGRVWIHEAYIKFIGAGEGDYLSSNVVATGTSLQQVANLDLILDGDEVKYSPGGPGTGTHGFASTPTLITRHYSKDGAWDYDGTTLTPNMSNTGGFAIKTVDTHVHRFVNKIPTYGDCATYFSMTSDETSEIPPGYYIEIVVHNVSNTNWHLSAIMEIYRERTTE